MRNLDRVGSMFVRAVVRRMKELGLNNTTLARRMKISRPYVVKVLRGDVNISLGAAARFAKAIGMDFVPALVPRQEKGGGDSGKEEGRSMDNALYHPLITRLTRNGGLVVKPKGAAK